MFYLNFLLKKLPSSHELKVNMSVDDNCLVCSLAITLSSDFGLVVSTMDLKIMFVHLHVRNFFQMVTAEKYEVKGSVQEAAIILTSCTDPKMQVIITLTSPVIREENGQDGGWQPHHSLSHCSTSLFSLFLLSL